MKYCTKCGNNLSRSDKFCANCGSEVVKISTAHRLQKLLDEPESIETKSHNNKEGDYELFYGGDGLSESTPVSIHSTSMEAVKPLMDKFIIDNCGNDCERTGDEYTIGYQQGSQKIIKVIQVQKSDKSKMKFFFDMSYQLDNFKDMINIFGDIPWGREVVDYQAGEKILVTNGPFSEFNGVIEEVDYENNLLKVEVSIFGRYTSQEFGFSQVKKSGLANTNQQYIGDQGSQESQKLKMKKWLQDSAKVIESLQEMGQPLTDVEKRVLKKYGKL